MEQRAHFAAVGAFVLGIAFLAFVALLWLGRFEFSRQFSYYDIYFTGSVTGLSNGAAVRYNGIQIGRVSDIRLDPVNVERIRVTAEIDSAVAIKVDAIASLENQGLTGVSFVQIRGGTQDAPALERHEGERYPVIASRRSQLERVFSDAPQLIDRYIQVGEDLHALLDEKNRKAFSDTLDNMRVLSGEVAARSKELSDLMTNANATLAEVKGLVHDVNQSYGGKDGLKDQVVQIIGNYDRVAKNLVDTTRQLQAVLQDSRPGLRDFSQRTLGQVNDLISETRQLVSGLTRLAAQIEQDPTRFLFGQRLEGYKPR